MLYITDKQKISYSIVVFALILFSSLILWNANWVFELFWADDYQFVSTTAIGRPSHAYTGVGRFWPLGLCDYCLLLLIPYGTTVTAHLIYNCVTMIISSLLFFSFLRNILKNNEIVSVFCMLILFSLSSFVLIHMVCIYPEREMFLMLSVFLFFYQKARNGSEKFLNYVIAFIAAAYTTYLKEPVFGMWIVFALSNLIFGTSVERKFNFALLLNSSIWIVIYTYRTLFRDRSLIDGGSYAGISSMNFNTLFNNFLCFFNKEPILYLLLIIAIVRTFIILKDRKQYNSITDAALFAGVGYSFAYVLLNMQMNHYSFPSVLLEIPAFAIMLANSGLQRLLVCVPVLTSVYSIGNSILWMNNIFIHRENDPKMFEQLIAEQKSGKQILWITEPGKEVITKQNSREGDQMRFRRYQIFLDYYAGYHEKQHFPFEKVSDYSKIKKNTIVICSNETLKSKYGEEIIEKINQVGLKLIHENQELETKIFLDPSNK
ncbi:MAG: hypothetical protein IJ730_06555 [Alphaproteobacteria bacterium]|nr:hypothetical protein [Alphaproteobacteria bacterium]